MNNVRVIDKNLNHFYLYEWVFAEYLPLYILIFYSRCSRNLVDNQKMRFIWRKISSFKGPYKDK